MQFSQQEVVPKSSKAGCGIALRLLVLFAPLAIIFYYADIGFWFTATIVVLLTLTVLVGDLVFVVGELPIIGVVFLAKDFVLGFPELILTPSSDRDSTDGHSHLENLVGQIAKSSTPLRPQGRILVDGIELPAASDGGVLIEKDAPVKIVEVRNGTALVIEAVKESS